MNVRYLAVWVAVVSAISACGPGGPVEDDGSSPAVTSPAAETPTADAGAMPPTATPTSGAGATGAPNPTTTSSPPGSTAPPGEENAPAVSTDDHGPVGANGRAYLRPAHPILIVEIDVQEGADPDPAAIDHLASTIRRYADKREVRFAGGNTFPSERREWTRSDLRRVADAHRRHRSDAQAATLYVLYVRGAFHQDGERTEAVGVAHSASEIALFPERWSGLGGLVSGSTAIERAVLVHEFGHVLGLVNLTYESDIDHEDPEHPGHSSNRRSVMFWAVETTLIGQVFDGPPPDEFDDADRADIEGLRTGRY